MFVLLLRLRWPVSFVWCVWIKGWGLKPCMYNIPAPESTWSLCHSIVVGRTLDACEDIVEGGNL